MSNDLLRLLVIAAIAFVAYTVLIKDGSLIKNQGTMNAEPYSSVGLGEEEEEEAHAHNNGHVVHGIDSGANKKIINSQLDDVYKNNTNVLPHPQISNNYAPQGNFEPSNSHNFAQLDCFPKDQLVAGDLLPPEGGFAESNPATQGQLMNRNLFESAHHSGLNTQSNTLKNANRQIRSDPLIPRRDVGPWQQSTYEPDTNRRTFEIGTI